MKNQDRLGCPWIFEQLSGIKSLEHQLSTALSAGGNQGVSHLGALVAELNSRLEILDGVLSLQPSQK